MGQRVVRVRGDADLESMFLETQDGEAGRLAVPSREPVRPGERVRLEISFGALADEIVLAGEVTQVLTDPGEAPPRLVVRVAVDHEDRVRYVRQVLLGDRAAAARTHRRVGADIRVRWAWEHGQRHAKLTDLSRGGAFVVTDQLPPVGAPVQLHIDAGGSARLRVDATVSWVRERGERSGFGVTFKLRDRRAAAELGELVRKLEA